MRVALLVPNLEPSGGILTVVGHARRLADRGDDDVALVLCDGPLAGRALGAPVRTLTAVDAAEEDWDVAVATWWTTWPPAAELRARRRAVLLQGLDERFYRAEAPLERMAAALALAGPDHVIAVSAHLGEVVRALRPGVGCDVVPNGLDRTVFAPARPRSPEGSLRVLIEGQPGLWIKGVDDALAAVARMREPVHVTVVSLDPAAGSELAVDRAVGGLDARGMAATYAEADVLLKLSRSEGLGLPPLEAAAVGRPSVVTPYGGHGDWLRHGVNGILVGFDDPVGTAAWLDALARDPSLVRRLGDGALETARAWPSPDESSRRLAEVLGAISRAAPPDPDHARHASARAIVRAVEVGRPAFASVSAALAEVERQRTRNADLVSQNRALRAQTEEALGRSQLAEERLLAVTQSRAYRVSVGLRAAWGRARGPLEPLLALVRRARGWRR